MDPINENDKQRILRFFDKPKLPDFVSFEYQIDGTGNDIPTYAKIFSSLFDPQSILSDDRKKFVDFRKASTLDYYHAYDYLTCDKFTRNNVLKNRRYDSTVNAIISFMISWDIESLNEFGKIYPNFDMFSRALIQHDRNYVYEYDNGRIRMPYVLTGFKLIKSAFPNNDDDCIEETTKIPITFQLLNYIDHNFVAHLRKVYYLFRTETATLEDLKNLEQDMSIPYDLRESIGDYDGLKRKAKIKFITGQACAGKTTLLNSLKRYGWVIMSRGDVGSFSGKVHNPVAVACLHASIEWVHQHSNVLGVNICLSLCLNRSFSKIIILSRIVLVSTIYYG
jgi:cell wall assembly regulator SMI1